MKKIILISLAVLMSLSLGAQTNQSAVDTLSSRILLPRGTAYPEADLAFQGAVKEIFASLDAVDAEIYTLQVEGSTSPDGLWGNNIALSKSRTENAARYIMSAMKVPAFKIKKLDLHEDWNGLAEIIKASDLQHKDEALSIIGTLNWGERKTALRNLDEGKFWEELEKNYFPKLRAVTIKVIYRGKLAENKISAPEVKEKPKPKQKIDKELKPKVEKEVIVLRDTIYVRDTVYIIKESVPKVAEVHADIKESVYETRQSVTWDSPWMMGFKTNLLSDAIVTPTLGLELQLSKHMSLDVQAWVMACNAFVPSSQANSFYGASPELRWWFGDRIMRQGSFLGLHANVACYDIEWRDGNLYEAALGDVWSAGLTYGYSLGLGKKDYWGLEFIVGAGYLSATQNLSLRNTQGSWQLKELQKMKGFGLTKLGINLTYRFSVRKYNETR